jgi:hypothetical protein
MTKSVTSVAAEIARRQENARKFVIGGMAAKYGLDTWLDDELLGAMEALSEAKPEDRAVYNRRGREIRAEAEALKVAERVFTVVQFERELDRTITRPLNDYGLRWDKDLGAWKGRVAALHVDECRKYVEQHGGWLSTPDPVALLGHAIPKPATQPAAKQHGTA